MLLGIRWGKGGWTLKATRESWQMGISRSFLMSLKEATLGHLGEAGIEWACVANGVDLTGGLVNGSASPQWL